MCLGFLVRRDIQTVIRDILEQIWAMFGTPSDIFWHEKHCFYFITYKDHTKAESAIAGLNDEERLRFAIATVAQRQSFSRFPGDMILQR